MRSYLRIDGYYRKPNPEKDGGKNYGKPCVICGAGTIGEKFVQVNWMRGEDETARVCAEHWNLPDQTILEAWQRYE